MSKPADAVDPVAHLRELAATAARSADALADGIRAATGLVRATVTGGGTLFFAGNGGSAADAHHIATEYVVRYMRKRRPPRAIALTADTSLLTAKGGGKILPMADICLVLPTDRTDHAQEVHLGIQHAICDVVDAEVAG